MFKARGGSRGGFRGGSRGGGSSYEKPKGLFINGNWHCDCNPRLPAVHFQVKKQGPNHGKWFYACQKQVEDSDRCKFFLWESDAKPREQRALQSGSRTEPEPNRADRTPSRPQRNSTPPSPYSEPVRKRYRSVVDEDEDEFGINEVDPAFDDELRVMAAIETPRKAARTESYTTPMRKLPWENPANGMPTPVTAERERKNLYPKLPATPGESSFTPSKGNQEGSTQTLSPRSPIYDTPTPLRFKDVGSARPENTLVEDVFNLLGEEKVHLNNDAAASLRTLLGRHAKRAEGNNKGKEVLRLRIKAEEAKNVELTHRNNTLKAELDAVKATVGRLNWEREHGSDI